MESAISHQPQRVRRAGVQRTNDGPRKYLELTQDVIVLGLCAMLFVAMLIKLVPAWQSHAPRH